MSTWFEVGDPPSTYGYLDRLPAEFADVIRFVFLDFSGVSVTSSFEPSATERTIYPAPPAS